MSEVEVQEVVATPVSDAPVEIDPVEESAMKFTRLLPYVKKFGGNMSAKGLTRVMHAVAEFPLGAGKPRLLNEAERQLFHVLQELQGHKATVIQAIIQKNALEQQLKQTQEAKVSDEASVHGKSEADEQELVSKE